MNTRTPSPGATMTAQAITLRSIAFADIASLPMNAPTINLSELALELTRLSGRVFQTHTGPHRDKPSQLHARGYACFHLAEVTYPSPTRWRVTACGLDCWSPLRKDEESIHLNPTRPADAIARDILRRLPDAPAIYARANEYKAQKEKEQTEHAAIMDSLVTMGFRIYHDNKHSASASIYPRGDFHSEITATVSGFTRILRIMEAIK